MAYRIAVVDDDTEMLSLVNTWLLREGYETAVAVDGNSGLGLIHEYKPDLVVLDCILPGMDGWSVCRRIREIDDTPVIMLTGRDSSADRLRGFDSGCDDYVGKPCDPQDLLARIRAVLRRLRKDNDGAIVLLLDGGRIHLSLDRYRVALNGQRVNCTPTEYRMLHCLAQNRGRTVSHMQLLSAAWNESHSSPNEDTYAFSRAETKVYINYLRRKLGDDAKSPSIIETVRTVGYRLAV